MGPQSSGHLTLDSVRPRCARGGRESSPGRVPFWDLAGPVRRGGCTLRFLARRDLDQLVAGPPIEVTVDGPKGDPTAW